MPSASSATASSRRTSTSSRARWSTVFRRPSRPSPRASIPASRPLFIYVKKAHVGVIPGIAEFIAEYTSEKALGEEGYLADKGLIPPPKGEIAKIRATDAEVASSNPARLHRSSEDNVIPRITENNHDTQTDFTGRRAPCWPQPRVSRRRRHSRRAPRSRRSRRSSRRSRPRSKRSRKRRRRPRRPSTKRRPRPTRPPTWWRRSVRRCRSRATCVTATRSFDVQYVDRNRQRDRIRARLNANFRVNDTITGRSASPPAARIRAPATRR